MLVSLLVHVLPKIGARFSDRARPKKAGKESRREA
jgi:hypothetical protein